jgi:hypothetical protein
VLFRRLVAAFGDVQRVLEAGPARLRAVEGVGAKTAEALRQRTVEAVAAWYGRTGCLWDFYDCDDRRPPGKLGTSAVASAGLGEPLVRDCAGTAAVLADLVLRPKP